MNVINDGSTSFLSLTFYDQNDALVTPSEASYIITNGISSTPLVDWTTFTPSGSSCTIEIPAAVNTLTNLSESEDRIVCVKYVYAGTRVGTERITYTVANIESISAA